MIRNKAGLLFLQLSKLIGFVQVACSASMRRIFVFLRLLGKHANARNGMYKHNAMVREEHAVMSPLR